MQWKTFALFVACSWPVMAVAQQSDARQDQAAPAQDEGEAIVVTAQLRQQTRQTGPISVDVTAGSVDCH